MSRIIKNSSNIYTIDSSSNVCNSRNMINIDNTYLPPFPVEQLQQDICTVFLLEARRLTHLINFSVDLRMLGFGELPDKCSLLASESTAADAGLRFEAVANTEFAKAMLDHYDYGFRGVTGTRSENMLWDSIHTYLGAYVLDLRNSAYVVEWLGEGVPDLEAAINRCLNTIEISNARVVLESNEPFYHFSRVREDDSATAGELTIRQLAMLAGVEEMSLRSMISRKSAPLLQIEKTSDRRTVVRTETAKEWLKAKGRYITIQKGRRTVDLDLARTSFADAMDLIRALEDWRAVLCDRGALDGKAQEPHSSHLKDNLLALTLSELEDEEYMKELGTVLKLPGDLLAIRAREAGLKTRIFMYEHELKQVRASLAKMETQ